MSQPLQLHYWPTLNGWKISIALEEMGLPYELVAVNIGAGEQFRPEFQAISPNGWMPRPGPAGRRPRCGSRPQGAVRTARQALGAADADLPQVKLNLT
jgi:hypothetical protein